MPRYRTLTGRTERQRRRIIYLNSLKNRPSAKLSNVNNIRNAEVILEDTMKCAQNDIPRTFNNFDCGLMDLQCRFCNTKHFEFEVTSDRTAFTSCCHRGSKANDKVTSSNTKKIKKRPLESSYNSETIQSVKNLQESVMKCEIQGNPLVSDQTTIKTDCEESPQIPTVEESNDAACSKGQNEIEQFTYVIEYYNPVANNTHAVNTNELVEIIKDEVNISEDNGIVNRAYDAVATELNNEIQNKVQNYVNDNQIVDDGIKTNIENPQHYATDQSINVIDNNNTQGNESHRGYVTKDNDDVDEDNDAITEVNNTQDVYDSEDNNFYADTCIKHEYVHKYNIDKYMTQPNFPNYVKALACAISMDVLHMFTDIYQERGMFKITTKKKGTKWYTKIWYLKDTASLKRLRKDEANREVVVLKEKIRTLEEQISQLALRNKQLDLEYISKWRRHCRGLPLLKVQTSSNK